MTENSSESSDEDTGGHVIGQGLAGAQNPLRVPTAPKADEDDDADAADGQPTE